MNKPYLCLSFLMGAVVLISNYLVQFPVNHFGLSKIFTYGAFSYPIAFLITDLSNRSFGKKQARKIVYFGFIIGVIFTLFVSTNFKDIISIRIVIGSGTAFLVAQLIDISVFDRYRKSNKWYVPPLFSSLVGSVIDTFLFFFYIILRNYYALDYTFFRRSCCENCCCNNNVVTFKIIRNYF